MHDVQDIILCVFVENIFVGRGRQRYTLALVASLVRLHYEDVTFENRNQQNDL